MNDDLRIALLGFGLAGAAFHAPVIEAVDGLRVAAVVTRDAERAARARASVPGVEVLADADQIWSDAGRYDAVVVATPNRSHVALATAAIDAGLPVVVDKPLAGTSAQAQSLVDSARSRGVLLTVYQNRRWDTDTLTLRRILDDGALGDVARFESRFERWRPTPAAGWRESADPDEAGGLLLDLGSHLADQALHLFGDAECVHAEVASRRAGAHVDDDVFLVLQHDAGVTSHLWASAVAAALGPRLRVLGSTAAFVVPELDPQETALRAGQTPRDPGWGIPPEPSWGRLVAGDAVRPVAPVPGDYSRFYAGWRDALRGDGPVPVDPADAVRTLRLLETARGMASRAR